MTDRDTILTINVVEPALVRAVHMHSQKMGKPLKGLVLVHKDYANITNRPKDETGLFEEVITDFNDSNALQAALKPYLDRLLAVTCRYEEAIQPFSQVIPFLPFIHTPSETALFWSTEKHLMRDRLSNYDKSLTPMYQYMEEEDLPRLPELVKDFSFPVIVKPSGLSKALLVSRCENLQELAHTLRHTFKIIGNVYSREQYPGKPAVLVEEMMQGEMYSTDAYVTHDGQIMCLPLVHVTTAHAAGLPGFYGYEQVVPTGLPQSEIDAAFATATAAIKALSLSATTAHIEMFRTPQGWKIIEVGARIGGFRDALYREAYGLEHFYNDLAVRMGIPPTLPTEVLRHATAMKIYAEDEGYIEAINGLEEAKKLSSIVILRPLAKVGDLALYSANGGDPVIEGILSNEDPKQLAADVAKVRELISIEIRAAEPEVLAKVL